PQCHPKSANAPCGSGGRQPQLNAPELPLRLRPAKPVRISRRLSPRLPPARAEGQNDLRQNSYRNLRRARRADLQPDWRVNALDLGTRRPQSKQPLHPLRMRLATAKGAYIEAICVQRGFQCKIIDLGVVSDRGKCRKAVQRLSLQNILRPLRMKRHAGKALGSGEGRARVHDLHWVACQTGHRRKRLADMNGADDYQARARQMGVQEQLPAVGLDCYGPPAAESPGDGFTKLAFYLVAFPDQSVRTAFKVSDQYGGAARPTLCIQLLEQPR